MKKCPFCENEIPDDAEVCPHCNRDEVDLKRGAVGLPTGEEKTSRLAIASLVCAFLGLFSLGLFSMVGIGLGVAATFRIKNSQGRIKGIKTARWGIVCSLVIIVLNILVLIALPDFLKFSGTSKSSEAKCNLGAIFTCQWAYFGEYNTYGQTFTEIYWAPDGDNRYSYFLPGEAILNKKGDMANCRSLPPWLTPGASDYGFTAYAIGNIDNDTACEIWSINDAKALRNVIRD